MYTDEQKLRKQLEANSKQLDKKDETIFTQASIIEQTKQTLSRIVKEKEEISLKYNQQQQVRDEMEINFEGILRSYKQSIEQKQQQLEGMQSSPTQDNDLIRLKIRNEVEHPFRLDLQYKEQEIEDLRKSQQELRNKMELEKQRYSILKNEQEIERQRLKEKYQQEVKMMQLKMMQMKDIESMNEKEKNKMESIMEEKDLISAILEDREKSLKNLRLQLEISYTDKNKSIEQLTVELENERQIKRRMITDNEKSQDIIKQLEAEIERILKRDQNKNLNHQNSKTQDLAYQDIQRQLNDYIKLFEDEKDVKRNLEKKLNEVIKQLRLERSDNDKMSEERVHDLTQQLKDERHSKAKYQTKIKELLQEVSILNSETVELRERIIKNPVQEKQDKEKPISDNVGELQYKCKQLKQKNQKLKEKLKEANEKIMQLLQRRVKQERNYEPEQSSRNKETQQDNRSIVRDQSRNRDLILDPPSRNREQEDPLSRKRDTQPNSQLRNNETQQSNYRETYDQSVAISNNYQDFYKLRGNNIDYTRNPYQNTQMPYLPTDPFPMDVVSKQIRDDVFNPKQRADSYNR